MERIDRRIRIGIFIVLSACAIYGAYFFLFHTVIIPVQAMIIPNGPNGETYTSEPQKTTYYEIVKNKAGNLIKKIKGQEHNNTLTIDKIGVSAPIEAVKFDKDGNMGTPSTPDVVAWYQEGAKIGAVGTAILSGHRDTSSGKPAVFYHLSDLKKEDIISISDSGGQIYEYAVQSINTYPADNFPTKQIFASDGVFARLNLITCTGKYDSKTKNYTHRLVVSAILVR